MIAIPMLIMFFLGAIFGIWIFNPILRKHLLAQTEKKARESFDVLGPRQLEVIVQGLSGSGKTTVATLIKRHLEALGFITKLQLLDAEDEPCVTLTNKRVQSLQQSETRITVIEKRAVRYS